MLKKDFLVRQMEEFGKVLARILTFKKTSDWDKFEKELAEAVKRFTLIEVCNVEEMEADEFEQKIVVDKRLNFEQKKILATLLFEKMDYYLSMNEADKYGNLKNKCLVLYEYLANDLTENEYDLDIHYKLKQLRTTG